jgi:hypothetical protein
MQENNQSPYELIRNFIEESDNLPDKAKAEYISCLDKFAQGKLENMDEVTALNEFLENQIEFIEETAIDNLDTETVKKMTEIRNARLDLEEKIFSVSDKDENMDKLLNKISSAASL